MGWRDHLRQLEMLAFTKDTLASKLYLNEKFKKKAEQALQKLDSKLKLGNRKLSLNSLFDKETIDSIRTAEGNISKLQSFQNLHDTISIQNSLWDFLSQVNSSAVGIANKPGSDYITGTFHKLPILLFHNKTFEGRNKLKFPFEVYEDVLKNLLKSEPNTEIENESFLDNIKKLLSYRHRHEDFEGDDKIIMIFMMMLVIQDDNIDQRVLLELESLPSILENIFLSSKLEDNKLKVYTIKPFRERNSYVEYLYFKAWILRRCKEYELSKEICIEGKKKYPKHNARFLHGLVLVDFCEYHINRKVNKKASRNVKPIIARVKKAIEAYRKQTKDENDWLIQGTIMSLQNMLVYLLLQDSFNKILESESDNYSFIDADIKAISEMKKQITEDYESHFEMVFTTKLRNILSYVRGSIYGRIKDIKRERDDLKKYLSSKDKAVYLDYDLKIVDLIIDKFRNYKSK